MKNAMALSLVIACTGISSAFACPTLTGKYLCPGENGAVTQISQQINNGTTVYTYQTVDAQGRAVRAQTWVTDGVTRLEQQGSYSIPVAYSCEGDTAVRIESTFMDQGKTINLHGRAQLDAANNIHAVMDVVISGEAPQHEETVCQRL